jgi:hypothetical protein
MEGTASNGSANGQAIPDVLRRLRDRQAAVKAAEEVQAVEAMRPPAFTVEEVTAPRPSVAARLERKYALGQDAKKRRQLYQRCQAAVEEHGDAAMEVISSVVVDASRASRPAHYFCRTVLRRLREYRLLPAGDSGGDASW